jgi:diguanylate cyclase (GGDEF)-like protein/PAS domain S-box-containing protein
VNGAIVVTGVGVELHLAPALQALLDSGGGAEEDRGRGLRTRTHPDDLVQLEAVERALSVGEAAAAELRLVGPGEEMQWFSVLAQPTRAADGWIVGHVAAWRSIQADREQLSASEERFRLLAETASDIVYSSGFDRTVTWVSSSIERALGWTPDDIVGTWMSDLVHPDDLAWSAARRDRIYAGDRDAEASGSFVLRLRTKGGDYRWVSTTLTTHRDADGNPLQFTGGMKIIDDVMEERQRLAESEERFRLLAENATDVVQLSRDGAVIWVSPSVTTALGWSVEAWLELGMAGVVHPDDAEAFEDYREAVGAGASRVMDLRVRSQEGEYRWIQISGGPFLTAEGRRDGIVSSFRLIEEQVQAREELLRRATYDDLTGALKREPALGRLEEAALLAGDDPGYAILYVDLDHFKEINDTRGHAAGDLVLTTITERIARVVRRDDALARVGGDEFIVLLLGVADEVSADGVADLIRSACVDPVATPAGGIPVTCSIGVAVHQPGEAAADTIARADRAMYVAKQARHANESAHQGA